MRDLATELRRYVDSIDEPVEVDALITDPVVYRDGLSPAAPGVARGLAFAAIAAVGVALAIGSAILIGGPEDAGEVPTVTQPIAPPGSTVGSEDPVGLTSSILDGDWELYNARQGIPGGGVGSVAVSPAGAVWAESGNAIYRLGDARWESVASLPDGLEAGSWIAATDDVVVVPVSDPNREGGRLLLYDGDDWRDLGDEGLVPQMGVAVRRLLSTGELVIAGIHEMRPALITIRGGDIEVRMADENLSSAPAGPWIYWSMAISDDGVVWIGGADVVASFDGNTLVTHGLGTGDHRCCTSPLQIDTDGTVWAVNNGTLYRIDENGLQLHTPQATLDELPGAGSTSLRDWVVVSNGEGLVWLMRDDRLAHHDGTFWTGLDQGSFQDRGFPTVGFGGMAAPAVGPDDSRWVLVGRDGALSLFGIGESWRRAPDLPATAGHPGGNMGGMVSVAPDGSVWVATADGAAHFIPDVGS